MGIYSRAQFTKTGINSVKNDWGTGCGCWFLGIFFWKTRCESRALIYPTLNINLAAMRLVIPETIDNPRPVPMPTG